MIPQAEPRTPIEVDARASLCVARQPILDSIGRVFGYELLYRGTVEAADCTAAGDLAGARVLSDTLLTLGLDALTCGKLAFVNLTRSLLVSDAGTLLPATSTVLEIREDVAIDLDVVEACRQLHHKGFALALDDFVPGSPAEALLPYVRFVKVDVLQTQARERRELALRMKPLGIRLIAEKVETAAVVEQAHAAGYRLFQGYYFCRPTTFAAAPIAGRRLAYMGLLGALNRDDLTIDELEDLIKHDLSLAYRVLRSVNSWIYGLRNEVTTVRHALVLLGIDQIRKWASVWALAGMNSGGTQELVTVALLRARCCELVGRTLWGPEEGDRYFLLGLCSLLDVVLGKPMAEALAEMPLAAPIKDALVGVSNQPRDILDAVVAYEQARWDDAEQAMSRLQLPVSRLPEVYSDAICWARELTKPTSGAAG